MTRWITLSTALLWLLGCTTGSGNRHVEVAAQAEPSAAVADITEIERLRALLRQGDSATRAGRPEEAMRFYLLAEQFMTRAPAYPEGFVGDEVLWRIALLHQAQQRWNAAHEAWTLAAERVDRNGENLQRLGWARLQLRQHLAAREAFKKALIHDATHLPARFGLALACEALGEWTLAVQYLDEVLHQEPALVQARLARARIAMRQGDLAIATAQLRLALRSSPPLYIFPGDAGHDKDSVAADMVRRTYALIAELQVHEGDYASALEIYGKYLPLHEAFARLGAQAMQQRDYDVAIHYLEKAAKESPRYQTDFHKQLALAEELRRHAQRLPQ